MRAEQLRQRCQLIVGHPRLALAIEQSKALTEDETSFVGLPLDDENQLELTDGFISLWCEQILAEFGLKSK